MNKIQQKKKLVLYIAQSLDGYIARSNNNLDWLNGLENPDQNDYGYSDFLKNIDITIQGNKTYQYVVNEGVPNPYPDQKNYVFTRKLTEEMIENNKKEDKFVEYIEENPASFTQKIKENSEQNGKDIWIVGGAQINTLLIEARLIDQIILTTAPVIIGSGIKLFEEIKQDLFSQSFSLESVDSYKSGCVKCTYNLK